MAQLRRRTAGPSAIAGVDNRFYALRPAVHVHGRPVHSWGGSILVQQVRSTIGRTRSDVLREQLESLELRGIDDACFIDEADERALGTVKAIQHVLSVERLSTWVPPGEYPTWVFGDGVVMFLDDYGRNTPGELIAVGDGEYLQVETVNSRLAAMWSSTCPVSVAVSEAVRVFGEPDRGNDAASLQLRVGPDGDGGESGTGRVDEVLEYLTKEFPDVAFLRVRFEHCELLWSASHRRIANSDAAFVEIGVRLDDKADRGVIDDLISTTASPVLRERRRAVEAEIKQLVA